MGDVTGSGIDLIRSWKEGEHSELNHPREDTGSFTHLEDSLIRWMASWGIIQHLSDQSILPMPTAVYNGAIVMELLLPKKPDTSIAMFLFKPFIVIF